MNRSTTSPRFCIAVALAACALLPLSAFAQTTGVLTGTVTDAATRTPVPDVVVTATSPTVQGEQVVVTDASGLFQVPQLPPGTFTLRFEKEGFRPYSRAGIALRTGQTVRLNTELLPDSIKAEEIVVVGRSPTVDVGSSRTGVSIGTDFMRSLALSRPGGKGSASRSFESLAEVAPGATSDPFGVSVNGATSPENAFIIDGLSAGSPALGILGTPLTQEFVQEVNVITGGYMPEYGRSTGGILTAVTKSGSNEFHGSVFGNLTPGALEGPRTPIRVEGNVISTTAKLWNLGDFGAELGGPILQDKLWFYAGLAPSFTRRELERNFTAIQFDASGNAMKDDFGLTVRNTIPGTFQQYFADQRTLQYIGKLTYLITPDHRLTLSVYGAPTTSGGNGHFAYTLDEGFVEVDNPNGQQGLTGQFGALAHVNTQDARDVSLKLSSSFLDKKVLLDATVGWHHQTNQSLPSDGTAIGTTAGLAGIPQFLLRRTSNPGFRSLTDFESLPDPSVCAPQVIGGKTVLPCPVSSYLIGGPGFLLQNDLNRYQGNVVGTAFLNALGHHVIKAGVDVEINTNHDERAYSGDVFYREAVNGTNFQDFRSFGYLTGPGQATILHSAVTSTRASTIGGFIQDSWSILDVVTLNAGVRYDDQTITGGNGQTAFRLPNQLSPRVGAIWDPTQQGRAKVFANYARFYENAVLAMVNSQFTNTTRIQAYRSTTPINGGPGCNPLVQASPYSECRDERNQLKLSDLGIVYKEDLSQKYLQSFAINSPVDSDLKPQSSDELVLGGEYEVFANARAGATYTRRYVNDVIEDMSRNEATNYFIGNPGRGVASDFPKAHRDYDAVSVYFNKLFADLWQAQVSYSFSVLRGNYSGLFRPENGQLAPNVTSDFDLPSLTTNHDGLLPLDHTHSVKVYASKEFVLSGRAMVNLGLSYRGLSGAPLNVEASHPIYGPGFNFLVPRGEGGRLPWVHNIDARLSFDYRLTKDSTVSLSVDSFNVFNFQAVIAQDENYTFDNVVVDPTIKDHTQYLNTVGKPVTVNPNYGKPLAYQAPRSVRFGMRVTF